MRNLFNSIIIGGLVTTLASCSGNAGSSESAPDDSTVLVAYFSATGTTAKQAENIAKAVGGTLYEIQPEQPYTDADLDYENDRSRSSLEKHDPSMRPAIKTGLDIAPYETIYLGFPVWWYDAPNVIYTFLDSYDFSGKKIVVFATSGSSTLQSSFESLKKAYPAYDLVEGQIYNAANKAEFAKWVESLKK